MKTARLSIIVLTLLIAAAGCYGLSYHRPLVGDAMMYEFFCNDWTTADELIRVNSMADVMESQTLHYFNTNGRAPLHILVQGFAAVWGNRLFAVFNSIFFLLMTALLVGYMFPKSSFRNPWAWIFTVVSLLYLFPSAGESVMGPWYNIPVGINYLWAGVLFVAVLTVWRKIDDGSVSGSFLSSVLIVLLSFFAGWSNEAFAVPLSATFFILLLLRHRLPHGMQHAVIWPLWLGTALMVFAPGTLGRATNHYEADSAALLTSLIDCFLGIKLFWIFLISMAALCAFRRLCLRKFISFHSTEAIAFAIAFLFSSIANTYPHSLTCLELLSLILMVEAFADSNIRFNLFAFSGWPSFAAAILLLCCLVAHLWLIDNDNRKLFQAYLRQGQNFIESPDGVAMFPSVELNPLSKPFCNELDIIYIPNRYTSIPYAVLHGCPDKTIVGLTAREYDNLISRPEVFFTDGNLIPGSARMYETERFFIAPYIQEGPQEVVAKFDNDDFMKDLSLPRKIAYRLKGSRKPPKRLRTFVIHTRRGDYLVAQKILSSPSSIDFL